MRIDIVGLPGSGKSTLAKNLSKKLGIPHIQLDAFWFEAGGLQGSHDTPNIEAVREYISTSIKEAVQQESWISDGTYLRVQEYIAPVADVIVFIDLPLLSRLLAHTRRAFFEPKRHKHLKLWDEIKFYKQVVLRTYRTRPKLLAFTAEYSDKVVVLKSHAEINKFVEEY
ncbi:AAA family ATPase [Patescibacteria group bacterium]|nr:AAA family ATPase [Patescibacteria group bacterium]MBU2220673.1 AAA family ATPase [Patescibacteria group bacterium]